MRYLVLALALSACAETPEHTLGEAVQIVAEANCSRWIGCGQLVEPWRECVNNLVWDFCKDHDCTASYTEWDFSEVSSCAEWFVQVSCEVKIQECYL